jgi:hypothetical protein
VVEVAVSLDPAGVDRLAWLEPEQATTDPVPTSNARPISAILRAVCMGSLPRP